MYYQISERKEILVKSVNDNNIDTKHKNQMASHLRISKLIWKILFQGRYLILLKFAARINCKEY